MSTIPPPDLDPVTPPLATDAAPLDPSLDPSLRPARSRRVLHPHTPPWLGRAILFALAAYWGSRALVSGIGALKGLLVVVAVSFIAACALEVPVDRLSRRMRRGVATGLVMAVIALALAALVASVGALVASQVTRLLTHAPATARSLTTTINHLFNSHLQATSLEHRLSHLDLSHSKAVSAATASIGQLASLLMGLLFTFYLVAEGPKLRSTLCSFLPAEHQGEMLRAWELAIEKTGGYFASRFVLALLRSFVALAAMEFLHVPDAIALGIWFGVLSEFIPVVGTAIGIGLPVAVALPNSTSSALILLVVLVVFNQLRNFILAPKLTRHTVAVHPALAFASVVVAVTLFGPLAALLAIPALATLQAFFSSYISRHDIAVSSGLLHPDDQTEPDTAPPST